MPKRFGMRASLVAIALLVGGCTGDTSAMTEPVDAATDAAPMRDSARPELPDAAMPADSDVAPDARSEDAALPEPPTEAGRTEPDAMAPPVVDSGSSPIPPSACGVLFEQSGLVHESVEGNLKARLEIPVEDRSYDAIEVGLDVHHGGWTRAQGQHEIFTLLRADRWVGNAVAYVAAAGGERRFTVLVSNLDLPGAAAPDGRRVTRNFAYEPGADYHLEYRYDAAGELRRLQVIRDGVVVSTLDGTTTIAMTRVPTVEVGDHFMLLLGGEENLEAPDASTLGWRFSNVVVRGCPH